MCTFCFVIIGSYEVVMHLKIHVRRQSLFDNFYTERWLLFCNYFSVNIAKSTCYCKITGTFWS